MQATMQRLPGKLTPGRRAPAQAGTIPKLAGRRRRQAWAKSLQQLLDRASRSMWQPITDVVVEQLKTLLPDPALQRCSAAPDHRRRAAKQLLQGYTENPDA
jgi:hypothetical protein